ncbi:hypothetical protein QOZ80_5AG0386530 [Eleusine coracana subsp. coracana]|nr:hypothetical protein QOZ80_5AG0386530 [Eleusine coracana subsp. coracana]
MAETRESSSLHIVVFPWLAFGHITPFLELSVQLAKRGHAISFVSTPRNIARMRPIAPELAGRIRTISLPLPSVEGLPEGAESTADIPPEKAELLEVAFDGLAPHFSSFLAEACSGGDGSHNKPDCVIVDYAHHWLPPIADLHKVPCALFFTFPASMITSFSSTKRPRYETAMLARSSEPNASGISGTGRHRETAQRCQVAIFRTCDAFEGPLCPVLTEIFRKPALPSGMLAPHDATLEVENANADDEESEALLRWLDSQPERSVLYVAFGSEAPLIQDHIREVALGLELAGVRFLWVLRKMSAELLPDGFEGRVSGRGMVHAGWVRQLRVLAHRAVGGFMTHAGLNSVVECLTFGHRMVLLPLFGDQGHNARTMEERRVGLQVARNEEDGSFDKEDVATTVRRVMVDELFSRDAKELQQILRDRTRQERYIDELAENLKQLGQN